MHPERRVFFVDAAHFVMGAFLGMLWCFERLFLKSSSARRRYNVVGAFSVKGTDLITVTHDAYINSVTIVDLLIKIKQALPDIPLTLVMDNARYQRCNKVTEQAEALGIDIIFLPPYSPNLNLIERLWKFTKKKCLYNRYHETFCAFKEVIDECLEKVKSVFSEQIKTLLNPKFQLFGKSTGVTALGITCSFFLVGVDGCAMNCWYTSSMAFSVKSVFSMSGFVLKCRHYTASFSANVATRSIAVEYGIL
ncbi:MAG: IS630 family transposase [Methylicorpusculum sp.]|uniref:IS630 family transposase n=1 Tax=Methylicorpusculum sp. TaxID=2713644 RepID=UPI002716C901|nr:IS630 family transposase [Methylicorpusculum sp.]MDO8844419.1 IS630 family transposase [Methylicorpusculum sp.]MDO8938185.1 IS630 family transposase [Methylicorpusculum sp.]MDP2178826.1 IS630 family transposase [Methylicorpusculum sp.]MDP3529104.1 IS630 family transposase [Methylicorpusculum sp.]